MIIQYIVGLAVGWFMGITGLINILIILRFGLPRCNKLIKEESELTEKLRGLRKTYIIALIIWTVIITVITILCYIFLGNAFVGYIIALLLAVLLGIGQTGENENNLSDFENSLNNL